MNKSSSNNKIQEELFFGGHLVAFIDILGQSSKLSKLKNENWWELDQNTQTILIETYGKVLKFRKVFNNFLSTFCEPSVLDSVFQHLSSPQETAIWNQFCKARIITNNISDSLIMTFPLQITNGLIPLKSVYGVLGACASSMMTSLNYEFAIRGAIEIGPCVFDPLSTEVYGTALSDAVRYEEEADWPRIIIGTELVNYLESCINPPHKSMVSKINASTATRCLSVITKDSYGKHFLDYLGPGFTEFKYLENNDKIIEGAFKFINHQINYFRNDKKIRSKYIKLKKYFQSRLEK